MPARLSRPTWRVPERDQLPQLHDASSTSFEAAPRLAGIPAAHPHEVGAGRRGSGERNRRAAGIEAREIRQPGPGTGLDDIAGRVRRGNPRELYDIAGDGRREPRRSRWRAATTGSNVDADFVGRPALEPGRDRVHAREIGSSRRRRGQCRDVADEAVEGIAGTWYQTRRAGRRRWRRGTPVQVKRTLDPVTDACRFDGGASVPARAFPSGPAITMAWISGCESARSVERDLVEPAGKRCARPGAANEKRRGGRRGREHHRLREDEIAVHMLPLHRAVICDRHMRPDVQRHSIRRNRVGPIAIW